MGIGEIKIEEDIPLGQNSSMVEPDPRDYNIRVGVAEEKLAILEMGPGHGSNVPLRFVVGKYTPAPHGRIFQPCEPAPYWREPDEYLDAPYAEVVLRQYIYASIRWAEWAKRFADIYNALQSNFG